MATQGPNSPGTAADDATVGTLAWSNPDNIKVSDNVYASASTSTVPFTTHYLKATNFGFSIPAGATINGILVEIERKMSGPSVSVIDSEIKIVKSDGSIGSTNKSTGATWQTVESYSSFGGSSDLWGETWTSSDINSSNFGAVLSATVNLRTANVDHIRITITYTEVSKTMTGVSTVTGVSSVTL